MTDEELRKEGTSTVEWENVPMIDRPLFVHGYITGAKPKEKRIAELEKENESLVNIKNIYIYDLIKAKEIIKKIEKIFYSGEKSLKRLSEISDILAEAEQFLKESE